MKQYCCLLLIMINLQIIHAWAGEQKGHAMLIIASESPVQKFSNKELRLLFLGYPVTRNNQTYEPLINASHNLIYHGFLQKVMFMSENNYERKLIARVFRHGGERPIQYNNRNELIKNLITKPNAITFVMSDFALGLDNIQVIQQLW